MMLPQNDTTFTLKFVLELTCEGLLFVWRSYILITNNIKDTKTKAIMEPATILSKEFSDL